MINKKTKTFLLFSLVLISIFCVSAVNAQDSSIDESYTAQNIQSADDIHTSIADNNIKTYDDNKKNIIKYDSDKSIDKNIKTSDYEGTDTSYSELKTLIDSTDNINIESNYVKSESDEIITINKTLNINANGYTFDLNNTSTLFVIGADADVTIENAKVINNYGENSTFINWGKLTFNNVTFTNNNVTGYNTPALINNMPNSILYMNNSNVELSSAVSGVIVFNTTNVKTSIENSNFSNCNASNSVLRLWRNAQVNVTNSTFTNNYATLYGGAINSQGILVVDSCTFDSNIAETRGGAIALRGGNASISNSNFTNNTALRVGGAISIDTNGVILANNTMAQNTAPNGSNIYVFSRSFYSAKVTVPDQSIVDDEEIIITVLVTDDNGNVLTGGNATVEFNEVTYIGEVIDGIAHIVITDSIEPGNYTVTATYNNASDDVQTKIPGNVEIIPSPNPNYSKVTAFINENTNGTVTIEANVRRGSSEDIINITKDIILDLNGNMINANGGRMFYVANATNVTIKNAILYNAYGREGVILNTSNASVTFENVTVTDNEVYNLGFATTGNLIYIDSASNFTFNNSLAENNTASIIRTLGFTNITNSKISNTQMPSDPYDNNKGWIILDGKIEIWNSLCENNSAQIAGIYGSGQKLPSLIYNSTFINNSARTGNGGVMHCGDDTYVLNSTFINNRVTNRMGRVGGVFHNYGGDLTIIYSIFINNTSTGNGSILANYYGTTNIEDSILICQDNTSALFNEDDEGRTITANNNWWGTNDFPGKYMASAKYWNYDENLDDDPVLETSPDINMTQWVIMNTTYTSTEGFNYNDQIQITTYFNYTIDVNGTINEYNSTIPDGMLITYTSEKGSFENEEVEVINRTAVNNYTIASEVFTVYVVQNEAENIITGQAAMPDPLTIILNDGNYTEYFDEEGKLREFITPNSELQFDGEFNNRNMIIDMPVNLTTYTNQAKLYNSIITFTKNSENSNMSNIQMANNNTTNYLITIENIHDITVTNVTLNQFKEEGPTHSIIIKNSTQINIDANNITTVGPSADIDFDNEGVITTGISVILSNDITIKDNNITTNYTGQTTTYGTVESILVTGIFEYDYDTDETAEESTYNTTITNNTIITESGNLTYGISIMDNAHNNTVDSNDIISYGKYYANGIQIGGPSSNNIISNNNIIAIADNVTYAMYVSTNYNGPVTNNIITHNNLTADSSSIYLIELWSANSNNITYNNFEGENDFVLAIGTYNSQNNQILYNNMTLIGGEGTPIELDNIQVETTGIKLTGNSNRNTIQYNNITATSPLTTNAINATGSSNNIITDNYLIAGDIIGDNAVINNSANTIQDNLPQTPKTIIINAENTTKSFKESIDITVNVTFEDGRKVNEGNIITKYDQKEETIPINEGTVTIHYDNDTVAIHEIELSYDGNELYESNTTTITVNVTKLQTQITIQPIETAYIGQEITLTVNINDENDEEVNTGSITFTTTDGKELATINLTESTATAQLTFDDVYSDIIIATYNENPQYETSTTNTTATIKSQTKLTINPIESKKYNTTFNITGLLTNQLDKEIADAEIIIQVNDNPQETIKTNENGEFTYSYTTQSIGTNNITITFQNTTLYDLNTTQQSFEVTQLESQIILDEIEDASYDETVTINGTLKDENENPLTNEEIIININGQEETITTDNNGQFIYSYKTTTVGTNNITLTYTGNPNIQTVTTQKSFQVNKATIDIELITSTNILPDTNTPIVIVTKDSQSNIMPNQTVQLTIDENNTIIELPNGLNTYNFIQTTPGTYTITATLADNENYQSNPTTITITVIEDKDKIIEELNNTIQEQNKTIENLTNIVQEQADAIDNLTSTIEEQQGVIDDLNSTVNAQNSTINALNDTVNSQNKTIENLTNTVEEQQGIIDDLNSTVNAQNATISALNDTVQEQNATINGLNDTVNAQDKTIGDLNDTVQEQNVTINGLNDTVNAQNSTISALNDTVNSQNKTIENLTSTVEEQQGVIDDLNSTVKSQNVTINDLNKMVNNQNKTISDLNNTVKSQNSTINGLNDTVKSQNATINGLNNTVKAQDKTIGDLNGTVKSQNVTINDLNKTVNNQNKTISDLNNTVKAQNSTITALNDTVKAQNNTIANLNNTVSNLNEEINNLTQQVNRLNEIIANLTKTKDKLNTSITINPITGKVGSTTTITANIVDINGNKVNEGKVVFKANGITLKDSDGNVIYSIVENGVATLKYEVPKGWIKNTTVIEAVYSQTDNYQESRTNTSNIKIQNGTVKLAINNIPQHENGDKTQFIIKVTDENSNPLNAGSVIIKANGVTLKDASGKAIQAKVENGVAIITYDIALSARTYNLTAVYASSGYERTEAQGSLTVTKDELFVQCDPITTKTNTTTITAKIVDKNKQPITSNVKVGIKVNGKTITTTTAVNGTINVTIPTNYKAGTYNLQITAGETGAYKSDKLTTVIIKE